MPPLSAYLVTSAINKVLSKKLIKKKWLEETYTVLIWNSLEDLFMAMLPTAIKYFPKRFILVYQLCSKCSFIWHCTHITLWTYIQHRHKKRKGKKYREFLQAAFFCKVNLVHKHFKFKSVCSNYAISFSILKCHILCFQRKETKVIPVTILLERTFIFFAITCINTYHRD